MDQFITHVQLLWTVELLTRGNPIVDAIDKQLTQIYQQKL